MENRWGKIFAALSGLSLLLAVRTGLDWSRSMKGEAHLISFLNGGERYTLKSRSGQFALMSPPREAKQARTAELMATASNADFDFRPGQSGFVWGVVKKFTPTWTMWQANWQLWEGGGGRVSKPAIQPGTIPIWLEAMEDDKRFVPAHMMLLFAAEETRNKYFRWDRTWGVLTPPHQPRRVERPEIAGGGPNWSGPLVSLDADASGKLFDPSLRLRLRQEWHDVLDRPRWAVFHGWVIVAALVMPIVWTAQPRMKQRTIKRWTFNGLTIASLLLGIGATILWVRSYWASDHWSFLPREIAPPQGMSGKFFQSQMIGSGQGMLRYSQTTSPAPFTDYYPWGHGHGMVHGFSSTMYGVQLVGEKYLRLPGLEVHTVPAQILPAVRMSKTVADGMWTTTIAWWIVVVGCALLPLLWGWGATMWWLRTRQVRLQHGKICKVCGYDLQATAERCPECGTVPDGELLKM